MEPVGSFDSTKIPLHDLLDDIRKAKIQLPDFQRGWVWDDEHVRSLLASVSLLYPIGAVMLLQTGNPAVRFKPRPVEGVSVSHHSPPEQLILDGQQRLTSLYQALMLTRPVTTHDSRRNEIQRYYYIDLATALDPAADREEAIFGVPEDRILRNFRGEVVTDLSTLEKECAAEALPVNALLDVNRLMQWQMQYLQSPGALMTDRMKRWTAIMESVVHPFQRYQIPLILLNRSTSKDAVCQVFEKVNTGGVSLTVFELLTATYAAEDFNLRDDWDLCRHQFADHRVLRNVESTDLLQTVALLSTWNQKKRRPEAPVGCKRKDVLDLDLSQYREWAGPAVNGYQKAARFLFDEHLFAARDVPYRTQLIPLAAILAELGPRSQHDGVMGKVRQWFWCGVLGELYGGSIESRFARDLPQVLTWVDGGPEPDTVLEANFRAERLRTLRTRNSAAYKGVHALLLRAQPRDFRSGRTIDSQVYFEDGVDIHHVFPRAWLEKHSEFAEVGDCIVNKTPLSAVSNRAIGGRAPSHYLQSIQREAGISAERMDELLASHRISPEPLREDNFAEYFAAREQAILEMVQLAMGRPVSGIAVARPLDTEEATPGPGTDQRLVSSIPVDAKAILLVEGATDEQYLRLAADICRRPDLLAGLHIIACRGAGDLAQCAVALQLTDGRPILALFDRDASGKAGREMLVSKFKFGKQQLVTYADVIEGNAAVVEAEDLFPVALLQGFVDASGQELVLSEKVMDPQRHTWHFGFNAYGKETIVSYLREHASSQDLSLWVRMLEMIRTRAGLTSPGPSGRPQVGTALVSGPVMRPVEESVGESFDWSEIDRAVSLIPSDRWTSYGDLAQLGRTSAQAVGAHLAASRIPQAHHVLDGSGRVRPGFRWHDALDVRDPVEVLAQEGIRFEASGAASKSQRLRVADLTLMLDGAEPRDG